MNEAEKQEETSILERILFERARELPVRRSQSRIPVAFEARRDHLGC